MHRNHGCASNGHMGMVRCRRCIESKSLARTRLLVSLTVDLCPGSHDCGYLADTAGSDRMSNETVRFFPLQKASDQWRLL
jgi:hypothetical protein